MRISLVLALFVTLTAGCDSSDSAGGSTSYAVELHDAAGSAVANGELDFDSTPNPGATTSGQYTLSATGGGPMPPLTTTSGSFTGSYEADSLVVHILPATSDSGVRFAGVITAQAYSGSWFEITIAGPHLRGTFVGMANGD